MPRKRDGSKETPSAGLMGEGAADARKRRKREEETREMERQRRKREEEQREAERQKKRVKSHAHWWKIRGKSNHELRVLHYSNQFF